MALGSKPIVVQVDGTLVVTVVAVVLIILKLILHTYRLSNFVDGVKSNKVIPLINNKSL